MKATLIGAGCIAALLAAPRGPQTLPRRAISPRTCFTCHGTDGRSVGMFPGLAGRDKATAADP